MRFLPLVLLMTLTLKAQQHPDYASYPVYTGNDLGLQFSENSSWLRIWSPPAEKAELLLFREALGGEPFERIRMQKGNGGVWEAKLEGNREGIYYAFRVLINGKWSQEVPDPYVKLVGVNGRRGYIGDLRKTDPHGWAGERSPAFARATDAVVYELHVRDASIHHGSGISAKGKFKGLTERGTRNKGGLSTGLDHIRDLGVTHIHLLPSYDFYTVDETKPEKPQYNWGYDPLNYNVPEGSYSTDARDPYKRVREFKDLIKTFHANGLRVVMDVVYNHTMLTEDSWFNQLVPGYYYRQDNRGGFSNATACGNETASERAMFRKFMLESVKYWVEEYHVDGFRFDLMGVHDIETMNLISAELRKMRPDILLYGEGWTAGPSPLPEEQRAVKRNAHLLDGIAVFSDDLRDGIKGSVFEHADKGFASGKPGMEESIKFGVTAALQHPQVDYSRVNYSRAPYAAQPSGVVSYCECHDNHVLFDKLAISAKDNSEAERRQMHKLALGMVLTSQGISFLHAGTEFLRSKQGVENSFVSPDSINQINWDMKTANRDVYDYVRGLISMRKAHPAFRLSDAGKVHNLIRFHDAASNVVSFTIDGAAAGDSWKQILVVYNGNPKAMPFTLPSGKWKPWVIDNTLASRRARPSATIGAWGMIVYYQL